MEFNDLVQNLNSSDEKEIKAVYYFILNKMETKTQRILRQSYACKDRNDFQECFDDAFLVLKNKVLDNTLTEQNISGIEYFLINTTRNIWSKHKNNPRNSRPEIRASQKGDVLTSKERHELEGIIKEMMNSVGDFCKRILGYLPVFNPKDTKKITHKEIAVGEGLPNALASRHAREDCKNGLQNAIEAELTINHTLKDILDKLFDL